MHNRCFAGAITPAAPALLSALAAPAARAVAALVVALVSFAAPLTLMAAGGVPAVVQEAIFPGAPVKTQYSIQDTSSVITAGGPFDLALFLVTTTGNTPSTTNADWTAQSVDATAWAGPMPEVADDHPLSWQQYTGLTFTQAFPSQPLSPVNGYFLDYLYDAGTNRISFPGNPIFPNNPVKDGFFFVGSPSSTFFTAGPADGVSSFAPGAVVSFSGPTTETPEPASFACLASVAACALAARRRRDAGKR